jgi:hypothetical protein
MEDENPVEKTEEKEDSPIMSIVYGLGLFALAYYFYYTFTQYEGGESIRMNRIVLLIYGIGGKWVPVGIASLLGAFSLFTGAKGFMKK